MEPWPRSDVLCVHVEGLVKKGLLYTRTTANEWIIPGGEDVPLPPDGYIVSFIPFHEQGFVTPPHRFLRGLLHYYELGLQHLNPNGIQHISAFIVLCEGYLGIEPNFELWKYFFVVELQKKKEKKKSDLAVPMGCASIHL